MKFYCPGVIATSEENYWEREGYMEFPTYSSAEFPTLQVILCVDENHKVLHLEETCHNTDVPTRIFARARELNRQAGNTSRFSSWSEVALGLRRLYRRIAALAVPYNAASKIIPGSTSIVRMISIYQSWPYEVSQPFSEMLELYQKYWDTPNGKIDRGREPFIAEGTEYLEYLYRVLIPGHTREIYHDGSEIEEKCRRMATRELVWEKLGLYESVSPVVSETEYNRQLIRDAMKYRELQKKESGVNL